MMMQLSTSLLLLALTPASTRSSATAGSASSNNNVDCQINASGQQVCEPRCHIYAHFDENDNQNWNLYTGVDMDTTATTDDDKSILSLASHGPCIPISDLEWHTSGIIDSPHPLDAFLIQQQDNSIMNTEGWSTDVRSVCPGLTALLQLQHHHHNSNDDGSNNAAAKGNVQLQLQSPIYYSGITDQAYFQNTQYYDQNNDRSLHPAERAHHLVGASTVYYNASVTAVATTTRMIPAGSPLSLTSTGSTRSSSSTPTTAKSLEWLQSHAICIDTGAIVTKPVVVATDNSDDATNNNNNNNDINNIVGAYATRNMPLGTILTVSPVMAIEEDLLAMLNFTTKLEPVYANVEKTADHHANTEEETTTTTEDEEEKKQEEKDEDTDDDEDDMEEELGEFLGYYRTIHQRHIDEIDKYQLLNNYCWGNVKRTNLLLCPVGVGVAAMNHYRNTYTNNNNKDDDDDDDGKQNKNQQQQPNVGIRWTRDSAEVLTQSTEEILSSGMTSLALEYYALKDIVEGDELLLDYGQAWEDAMESHRRDFGEEDDGTDSATSPNKRYLDAREWNRQFPFHQLRTVVEQEYDPYPDAWQIRCHPQLLQHQSLPYIDALTWESTDYGYACRILDSFPVPEYHNAIMYTVQLEIPHHPKQHNGDDDEEEEDSVVVWTTRTDVPREAVRFFNTPGTGNLQLQQAFRHEMVLPADMLPEAWVNRFDDEEE